MARWFRVQEIGTVHRPGNGTPDPDAFFDPDEESVIEIFPRWEAGLAGIEAFSHLVVIFYLDRATRRRSAGSPAPPEGKADLAPVGFFATRTPKRPNPLGLSSPRLVRREGRLLTVTGLDAWPGTPVLDVKGYYPRDELRIDATVPGWLSELWARHDAERG